MYKDQKYRERPLKEIMEDIAMAKDSYGDLEKVFLCDGDAIALETDMLLAIIKKLYQTFPSLRHVGSYVGPQSTLSKSMEELKTLRDAGLTKAYLGVETGDDELLKKVKKGVGSDQMLTAGRNLIEVGINLSAMVLLGLAGKGDASKRHALATAKICNEMKPQYLAALTVTPIPVTVLYRQLERGEFELLDPFETLDEMKQIFENITADNMKFVGTHSSNYLSITGTLQRDKEKMIKAVDDVLKSRDESSIRPDYMRGL
jgi:radical SAM superfamily enzyme YgiQ (UPF0313 family)